MPSRTALLGEVPRGIKLGDKVYPVVLLDGAGEPLAPTTAQQQQRGLAALGGSKPASHGGPIQQPAATGDDDQGCIRGLRV